MSRVILALLGEETSRGYMGFLAARYYSETLRQIVVAL
jgi:hypothetical protein